MKFVILPSNSSLENIPSSLSCLSISCQYSLSKSSIAFLVFPKFFISLLRDHSWEHCNICYVPWKFFWLSAYSFLISPNYRYFTLLEFLHSMINICIFTIWYLGSYFVFLRFSLCLWISASWVTHCANIQIYSPSGYGTQKQHILNAELSQVEWEQLLCLVGQHNIGPTSETPLAHCW